MADISLANRYQEYKTGTKKVVNWLADTAYRYGDVFHNLPSMSSTNTLTTAQLLCLAQFVANASVYVPKDIIQTLGAVIRGREFCANWYGSFTHAATSDLERQNDSHRHFIDTLKKIEAVLTQQVSSQIQETAPRPAARSLHTGAVQTEPPSNMYSCLQIHEPTEDPLGPEPQTKPHMQVQRFELEDDVDPVYFALWCFLQDVDDLRKAIRNLWLEYRAGSLTFASASFIASFGIALVHDVAADLCTEHPALVSAERIFSIIGVLFTSAGDQVIMFPNDNPPPSSLNTESEERLADLDFLCPRAFILLRTFALEVSDVTSASCDHNNNAPDSEFDIHPLGQLMRNLLRQGQSFAEVGEPCKNTATDEFLLVLHSIARNPGSRISLPAMVVCQISMDIYDVVGTTPEPEMDHFFRMYDRALNSMKRLIGSFDDDGGSTIQTTCPQGLYDDQSRLQYMATDQYDRSSDSQGDSSAAPSSRYLVHRMLPCYTGLLMHTCATVTHRVGASYGNHGSAVLSMAYLYRSARVSGLLSKPWVDMDFIIETQNKTQTFVLSPSKGLQSMSQCYGMSLGMKLKAFSRGYAPPAPNFNYVQEHGKRLKAWDLPAASDKGVGQGPVAACIEGLKSLANRGIPDVDHVLAQYHRTGKLSPAQLIRGARESFVADRRWLDFDILKFSMMCRETMRQIMKDGGLPLAAVVGRIQGGRGWPPYQVAYAILCDAAAKSNQGTFQPCFLSRGSRFLDSLIEAEGSKCIDRSAYKNVAFGPTLPPDWFADKGTKSAMKDFIGMSSVNGKSLGMQCISEHHAKACAGLYSFYLQWERGDATRAVKYGAIGLADMLCEAIAQVGRYKMVHGVAVKEQSQESLSERTSREIKTLMARLGLSEYVDEVLESAFGSLTIGTSSK